MIDAISGDFLRKPCAGTGIAHAAGTVFDPILKHTGAFSEVDPEVLQRLEASGTSHSARQGDAFWRRGDAPLGLVVIKHGLVKLVRSNARGRSVVCGLLGPLETVGDVELVSGDPYEADALAASAWASVVVIPREAVLEGIKRDPKLAAALAGCVESELGALELAVDVLSAGSVTKRLATLLLKLDERFGEEDDGCRRIPVRLSRRDLGECVFTHFETAIRVMVKWERDHVVTRDAAGFLLHDPAALHKITGDLEQASTAAA